MKLEHVAFERREIVPALRVLAAPLKMAKVIQRFAARHDDEPRGEFGAAAKFGELAAIQCFQYVGEDRANIIIIFGEELAANDAVDQSGVAIDEGMPVRGRTAQDHLDQSEIFLHAGLALR
jgi:hypothetical protein